MRVSAILIAATGVFLIASACGNNSNTAPTAPTATYPQQPYPQPYPGQQPYPAQPYPGQQPYPTATAPGYPPPAYPPAPAPAPGPAAGGTLAVPGLLATPCQSDGSCGLHHCNTQYGKCAFPCQTPADCTTNNCVLGVCLPGS